MPTFRSFNAHIFIEDREAEEFNVKQHPKNDRECHAWIPSHAGKTFTVFFESLCPSKVDFTGRVYVDGVMCCHAVALNRLLDVKQLKLGWCRISEQETRLLQFAEIETTDDDRATMNAGDIGCIRLEICLVQTNHEPMDTTHPEQTFSSISDEAIHEKAKKLGGHRATMGEYQSMPYQACNIIPLNKADPGPHAVFKFFYRPMNLLQAEGIAPLFTMPSNEPGPHAVGQPQTPPAMSRQSPSTATSEPPVESEQTASNSRVPPPPKPMLLTRMNQQPPEAQNQASTRKSLFQRTLNKSDFEPSTSSKASSASTTLASIGSSRKRGKEKEKGRDREKDKERDRVMHGKHSKDSDEERLEILKRIQRQVENEIEDLRRKKPKRKHRSPMPGVSLAGFKLTDDGAIDLT